MSFNSKLQNLASYIVLSWGWRANLIAWASGFVCAFALAPFDIWPLAFVSFSLLCLVLDGASADADLMTGMSKFRRGFVRGWFFGFGYFLASLWWVATSLLVDGGLLLVALPFATILLPMGLAIFTGIGVGISLMLWRGGPFRLFALAFGLGLSEYMRGHMLTGFPWNLFGMAAMPDPLVMQSVSVLGLYGVTVLSIFVFASPVLAIKMNVYDAKLSRVFVASLAILIAIGHLAFGFYRLANQTIDVQPNMAIRVVQPNIAQSEKWDTELADVNFKKLLDLSDKATSPETIGVESFTHVIWPETALPFVLTQRPDAIADIAALLPDETTLITGAVRMEASVRDGEDPFFYNSVYALNGSAEIIAAQDKVRLVPFGEFIPLTGLLGLFDLAPAQWKNFGFSAGSGFNLIEIENMPKMLSLICYEIIFPGFSAKSGERPDWIVNVTNDAWFGKTPGPYQHLRLAQIRAVEEGLPVVRAANTGISALIDPLGRVVTSLGLGEQGVLDHGLPVALDAPLATRWANYILMAIFLTLFGLCVIRSKSGQ